MALAQRSTELLHGLPRGWTRARLELTLEDEDDAERAAVILGPAAPGRSGKTFRIDVQGGREPLGPSRELIRRVLARLDEEGIRGRLVLAATEGRELAGEPTVDSVGLADTWDQLLSTLPADWSHLYAEVALDSSDYVERAALLLAPANPSLFGGTRGLRFRCARTVGYGVSVGMARRCLERLDRARITGRVRILRAVSDSRPEGTQGPVWREAGRAI